MPWTTLVGDLFSGAEAVVLVLGLVVIITCAGVVYPAVWSPQESRRQATLELLGLLLKRDQLRDDPPARPRRRQLHDKPPKRRRGSASQSRDA